MAYMETATCICCGEKRTVVKDPMQPAVPCDPFCSEYCRKRSELGKCEFLAKLVKRQSP